MLSGVRSKWVTMFAGVIAAVVLVSVMIGLTSPDGTVDGDQAKTAAEAPAPTPTSPPSRSTPEASPVRAPSAVSGTWPGRPKAATEDGGSTVDWCPAVRTSGAAEARKVFGKAAVDKAACAAVRFVFDKRYSRLALPRRSYDAKDLDFVLPALAPTTVVTYRSRISAFVANPDSSGIREALGLVLLRGEGTQTRDAHASAGSGRVFYGKAFSTDGYRGRAAWINPTWSKVRISVDHSKVEARIVATLDATAAVPVFNTTERRDDMMTVPTHARFFLRRDSGKWEIGGWQITSGDLDYTRLALK